MKHRQSGPGHAWRKVVWLGLLLGSTALAQTDAADSRADGAVPALPLPTLAQVAHALSTPATRPAATLELVAAAALNQQLAVEPAPDPVLAIQAMADDRTWLDSLQTRFGKAISRSPVLDPAAWHLLRQLDAFGLPPGPLVPALGPELAALLGQLFNRADARQAVAVLPQVLWHIESSGTVTWQQLLDRAQTNPRLDEAMRQRDWSALLVPLPAAKPAPSTGSDWRARAMTQIGIMTAELVQAGPPDPRRLSDIRSELLRLLPMLTEAERQDAVILLQFADLVDGLQEDRYLHFAEGLLACISALDRVFHHGGELDPALVSWLADEIGAISASWSVAFNRVDPRINSALATAYDVSRSLARGSEDSDNHRQLADAVARLSLLVPDMDFYFDLPVRDPIAGGVDACAGIVAVRDPDGSPAMTRAVFDDCQQTLVTLADREARETQLSGDPDGPFGESQMKRELALTPVQRINYGVGYLLDRYATGCARPIRPLPNPLEWAYLANFMAWFAEQTPVFFQTPENEQRLTRMRAIGTEIVYAIGEQVDCLSGVGTGINDPVWRASDDYAQWLSGLGRLVRTAERDFRSTVLAAGADIALDEGADQSTAWRPSDVAIGPCDPANICEMGGTLSATRAMFGLFPDTFLVADQSGMGQVEICYDRMAWEDRRSTPVREDDPNVANYYGHLAFDLRGRYRNEEVEADLFAFRFKSPEEHHYMFAAASQEVLDDECPVEWLGQRVVSAMNGEGWKLVPNRLTYLSAPRQLPSRLLARNWDRGAEWRDWFVTGIGVDPLTVDAAPDISAQLSQHLQVLYRREQDTIYRAFLGSGTALGNPLNDELARLDTAKSLLRMLAVLFYPQTLNENDEIRSALTGQNGLLDKDQVERLREESVPVSGLAAESQQRLERFRKAWQALPEAARRTGSVTETVAHALVRLNALHTRFFQAPIPSEPPTPPPAPVSDGAPAPGAG